MVRSSTLNSALADSQNQSFKSMNNLLTLQENHVEEFFQYHGQQFLTSLEQLMEDVVQRVVSEMLGKLSFTQNGGNLSINPDCLREFEKIILSFSLVYMENKENE